MRRFVAAQALALIAVLCCGCHIIFPFDSPQADSVTHDAAPDHALPDAARLDLPSLLDYTGDLGFLCTCAMADANGDGQVNLVDFSLFKSCFGTPATGTCTRFDFNGDGVVGGPDLGCFSRVWEMTCPGTDGALDGLKDLGVPISEGSISPKIQRDWCCSSSSGTASASTSFTVNGPKRVLVAAVGILADKAVPDGTLQVQVRCTSCPGSPSLFQAVKSSSNQVFRAQLWYLTDPPQGQHTVQVSSGYTGTQLVALIASVWSGVDTLQPFYNNSPTNKLSGSGCASFTLQMSTACPAGSVAVDGALWIGASASQSPNSGQTINRLVGFPSFWLGSSYKAATPPSTTMGWTSSNCTGHAAAAECLKAVPQP
jgi:hypothetical protein